MSEAARPLLIPSGDMVEPIQRSKDGVPQWSGDSRSFLDYEESALHWEQSIAYHKRYLCGPRLLAELSGPAKKYVVGKRPNWLSFEGGVECLMSFLRDKLGRPQIPELSDYLNAYFRQSKRKKGESMNSYIVRKVELYARAKQALSRVQKHYAPGHERRERGQWQNHAQRHSWWEDATTEQATEPDDEDEPDDSEYYEAQESNDGHSGQWNNSNWGDWRGWQGSSSWGTSTNADWVEQTQELLPEFLQGWYLLADANLESHERNMIQTAVRNNYTLDRIAQELRSQWPEEDLQRRDNQHRQSGYWQEDLQEDSEEDGTPNLDALVAQGMTEDGVAMMVSAEEEAETALQAIFQAKRTLREARAKQHQVKMSRQYYKVDTEKYKMGSRPSSSNSQGIQCFRCGGPHKAVNCPDRFGPKPKEQAKVVEEAPFVCYADDTETKEDALILDGQANSEATITTEEAIGQGYGVIDGGATKTLGSVFALEAILNENIK